MGPVSGEGVSRILAIFGIFEIFGHFQDFTKNELLWKK